MNQDIRQWLDEIKRLQEQLGQLRSDRDQALASADQWRERYNTEAQQRREEVRRHQDAIAQLRRELEQLQNKFGIAKNEILTRVQTEREVESLETVEELKNKIVQITLERDRAREQVYQITAALEKEKADHLETRNSLTTALGDTMDLLTKAQNAANSNS
ncbi:MULTISPECIES: hypothetical protein [Limnospira]|uniref:Uncharacterized protein n=1 Tax=Limnospira indica PCC 8005 TaxID=376219 RepID=A0A9P1KJ41_9CYAN|nr:hypothetical protein [Limnospira indica]CDM98110.1 conserved protein of unknown function [Limnospira indica PCC 8005]